MLHLDTENSFKLMPKIKNYLTFLLSEKIDT